MDGLTLRDTNCQKVLGGFSPDHEIMPGVIYGRADQLLTPAYWELRCETGRPYLSGPV